MHLEKTHANTAKISNVCTRKGQGRPKDKYTQAPALPFLFQITHQTWDVILKSSLRIHLNPRQQLELHAVFLNLAGICNGYGSRTHLGDLHYAGSA